MLPRSRGSAFVLSWAASHPRAAPQMCITYADTFNICRDSPHLPDRGEAGSSGRGRSRDKQSDVIGPLPTGPQPRLTAAALPYHPHSHIWAKAFLMVRSHRRGCRGGGGVNEAREGLTLLAEKMQRVDDEDVAHRWRRRRSSGWGDAADWYLWFLVK